MSEETTTLANPNLKKEEGRCPHCNALDQFIVSREASLFTLFATFATFFFFGIFSVILIPIVVEASKTTVKRCMACSEVIEQRELFSLPSLSDQILNFRCGSCVLVISRKYALIALALLISIWFFFIRSSGGSSSNNNIFDEMGGSDPKQMAQMTEVRWENYVQDCGRKVWLENNLRAKNIFKEKYPNRVVEWKGVFGSAVYPRPIDHGTHKHLPPADLEPGSFFMVIKMVPTDSPGSFDLQLLIAPSLFNKDLFEGLKLLQHGDAIMFTATLIGLGGEFEFHQLKATSVAKLNKQIEIESIPTFEEKGNLRKAIDGKSGVQEVKKPVVVETVPETPPPPPPAPETPKEEEKPQVDEQKKEEPKQPEVKEEEPKKTDEKKEESKKEEKVKEDTSKETERDANPHEEKSTDANTESEPKKEEPAKIEENKDSSTAPTP